MSLVIFIEHVQLELQFDKENGYKNDKIYKSEEIM